MLDIKYIRENKAEVEKALLKRMAPENLDLGTIISLDDRRKELIQRSDELKAERNKFSKTKPDPEIILKMKSLGEEISSSDRRLEEVENDFYERMLALPNIPAEDVDRWR